MSISDIAATAYGSGSLASAAGDAAVIRRRLDTLTRQAGDGLIGDTFGGLGGGAPAALSLTPALTQVQSWQANVQVSSGRMQATQSALSQVSAIADNFFSQTNALNGLDATAVDTIAASARDALQQVAGLLDTKFGDVYVFAGTDTATAPVPDPQNILATGFATNISASVGQLAVTGAAATAATTLAVASSNAPGISPFSASLSQPAATLTALRPVTQIGDNQFVPIGITASANADVTSTGTSTTGSYVRDIMRALATIGALSSSQVSVTGFGDLVTDTHTSLGDAIAALNEDAGVLGNRSASLTASAQRLSDTETALTGQLSDAKDVDMAKTLTDLNTTQTQLQASYRLLGTLQSLSLADFLA